MLCPAEIKGSWDGWKEAVKMELYASEWVATVHLAPGTYYFKFIVDGRWCHLETVPHVVQDGNLNSAYFAHGASRLWPHLHSGCW